MPMVAGLLCQRVWQMEAYSVMKDNGLRCPCSGIRQDHRQNKTPARGTDAHSGT
jgi:hypothetical protein